MSGQLRLAYAGTPEFAVPALVSLAESGHHLVVVYTQPDRPAGRGRQLGASAVKSAAQHLGVALEQPATLKSEDARARLASHRIDVMVVAAYGLILPQALLDTPSLGCINIHASLLPRWRGAAPVQRAILAGDSATGISIMQMEAGLDTGPVYLRRELAIGAGETAGELEQRLAHLGVECVLQTLGDLVEGRANAVAQDAGSATYARKVEKSEARIDWARPAQEIALAVRAFNPRPIAETTWRGEQLRIWQARVVARATGQRPGSVVEATAAGVTVACGTDALLIEQLQLPGKKATHAAEFLKGHDPRGAVLGAA